MDVGWRETVPASPEAPVCYWPKPQQSASRAGIYVVLHDIQYALQVQHFTWAALQQLHCFQMQRYRPACHSICLAGTAVHPIGSPAAETTLSVTVLPCIPFWCVLQ
jgi:hypothetical protein